MRKEFEAQLEAVSQLELLQKEERARYAMTANDKLQTSNHELQTVKPANHKPCTINIKTLQTAKRI